MANKVLPVRPKVSGKDSFHLLLLPADTKLVELVMARRGLPTISEALRFAVRTTAAVIEREDRIAGCGEDGALSGIAAGHGAIVGAAADAGDNATAERGADR